MSVAYMRPRVLKRGMQLMTTVSKQIQSADEAICRNIESLADALCTHGVLPEADKVCGA